MGLFCMWFCVLEFLFAYVLVGVFCCFCFLVVFFNFGLGFFGCFVLFGCFVFFKSRDGKMIHK